MISFNDKNRHSLTQEQRRMYASEKLENFRWISKLVATYASYTLSEADLAPEDIYREVAELGQFAEVAYSSIDTAFLFSHLEVLKQPNFPLEGYDGLDGTVFLSTFRGTCADLPGYIAFRPHTNQLVVAIAGTSSLKHALQDLRIVRTPHPSKRGSVHTGFWMLYTGLKDKLCQGIRKAMEDHPVTELVVTGHSMGGCIGYLLCLDLLTQDDLLPEPSKPRIKLAVFGAPRTGDADLVEYFRESVASYLQKRGQDSFVEFAVKGYNDGVPALPPAKFGYRHFAREPFYTEGGKLYRTPASESEHALFHTTQEHKDQEQDSVHLFPRGGHNYYNGRDLERFIRRITWLDRANLLEEGWEGRYSSLANKNL